jgi:uncharacterized membrane protein YdbT with pleckstrin-like domain
MAYYTRVLQPGETVRYVGRLHWIIYKQTILFAFLTLCSTFVLFDEPASQRAIMLAVLLVFLVLTIVSFLRSWWHRLGTEIAVTDKRIIYKVGLIARRTEEMNVSKVESVDVDQGISGRLLGYGSVSIRGTGASWEPLTRIAAPLALRNAIIVG